MSLAAPHLSDSCLNKVYWTLLSKTLSSLANLTLFTLVGNPIGDDGFQQVASSLQQLPRLKRLHLCDIGVTWRCLAELEKILLSCPQVLCGYIYAEKKSFPPASEDITKVSSLTTLQLIDEKAAVKDT